MKNFWVRAASGLTLAALVVVAVLKSKILYGVIVLTACAGGVYEFYTITAGIRHAEESLHKKSRLTGVIVAVVCIVLSWLLNHRYMLDDIAIIFPVILFFYFIKALFSKAPSPFENLAWDLLPAIYIILPVMLLNFLYFWRGELFALSVLFLVWFYDAMCYIFGSLIGRRKLFERVSPNKTIEGLVGGMILSLTLVFFYDRILGFLAAEYNLKCEAYDHFQWLFIGFVIIVFATLGDLIESQLKRNIGIKDSGSILPGHGGFLDRLDAMLLAIPFAMLAVYLMDRVNDIKLLIDFLS